MRERQVAGSVYMQRYYYNVWPWNVCFLSRKKDIEV